MNKTDQFKLLDINLRSFDGEGGATGGDGGVASTTQVANTDTQATAKPQEIIYGKQDDVSGSGDAQTTPTTQAQADTDPAAEFESLIKGKYKDQFDSRIQQIIDKRFKGARETESRLNELNPIIDLLSEKYGAKDVSDLRAKMESELIEELAYEKNMDVDTYRQFRDSQLKAKMYEQHVRSQEWQQQVDQKVDSWFKQAAEMAADYPDFNLQEAVNKDPEFLSLLEAGISVKAAYEVRNIDTIKANTAKQAQENTVKSIQANGARPREAAAVNSNGPVIKSDVKSLTKADREEIVKQASQGKKIKF